MARPAKVWRNAAKGGAWYITILGKKERVGPAELEENEARAIGVRMLAKAQVSDRKGHNRVSTVAEVFLDMVSAEGRPSYRVYRHFLQSFKDGSGDPTVYLLGAKHVKTWIDAHPDWNESTRATAIGVLQACLNWASKPENGIIDTNPLRGMYRGKTRSRGEEALIVAGDHQTLIDHARGPMRDMLTALQQTGTRAANLCRARVENVDWRRSAVRLETHKTARRTGKPLWVPITKTLAPLIRRLCTGRTEGPLFRTSCGNAWTPDGFRAQLYRFKRRLAKRGVGLQGGVTIPGYRHTVATALAVAGVPVAEIVKTMGWENERMFYHHYGHLETVMLRLADQLDQTLNASEADRAAG